MLQTHSNSHCECSPETNVFQLNLDKMNNNQNNKNLGEGCRGKGSLLVMLRAMWGLTAHSQTSCFVHHSAQLPSLDESLCNGKAEKTLIILKPFTEDGSVMRERVKSWIDFPGLIMCPSVKPAEMSRCHQFWRVTDASFGEMKALPASPSMILTGCALREPVYNSVWWHTAEKHIFCSPLNLL